MGDAKHILLGRQTQSSSEQATIPSEKQLGAAGVGEERKDTRVRNPGSS